MAEQPKQGPRTHHHVQMSKYDKNLYEAWRAGFDAGWDERGDDNYPVKWFLVSMYWGWRCRRREESR